MTDFKSLNLAPRLDAALEALGYTTPTPIQLQAIPDALKGRDLMGIAQTGTGKTAAFALPLLDHICRNEIDPPKRSARSLILAPTRELASQIAVSVRDYGRKIEGLSVTTVFGGVSIGTQIKKLVGGNDVLVATPGRLIDLIDRKAINLSGVEVLILDEADQMMDMGFIHALKKIVPLVPKDRQTMFFSATMAPKILQLSKQFLTDPVKVSVTPANKTADRVTQSLTFVDRNEKQGLLTLALLDPFIDRALVFTRTKHGADRVVKKLAMTGIRAVAIHGNKTQGQRQRALQSFRDGDVTVMVATDIAARGIDIEGISHVFNFEIPNVPEQYVHRIGRTARANRSGIAIAYVDKEERAYLKDIQKLLKMDIPVEPLPEDFRNKVKELRSRKPLPAPEKPPKETRKGRGKSKKKSRFSEGKDEKRGRKPEGKTAGETSSHDTPNKPRSDKPKRNKSWGDKSNAPRGRVKPAEGSSDSAQQTPKGKDGESRAQRKAKNMAEQAAKHKHKGPKRPRQGEQGSERKAEGQGYPGSGAGKGRGNPKKTWSKKPDGQSYGKRRGKPGGGGNSRG